jgi:hypothetical protein
MTALIVSFRSVVPARIAGTSTSVVSLLAWGGMALGSYQGGYCFDLTGSYDASFASAGLAGIGNLLTLAAFALYLRWPARTVLGAGAGLARIATWVRAPAARQPQASPARG